MMQHVTMNSRSKTGEELGFSKARISPLLQAWVCQHFRITVVYGENPSVLEMKQIIL
jgi:hypothetical protein